MKMELRYCEKCNQMTNHNPNTDKCLKCEIIKDFITSNITKPKTYEVSR